MFGTLEASVLNSELAWEKNYSGVIGLHGNKQGLYFHQKGEMFPAASTVGCLLIAVVIEKRAVVIGDVVGYRVWLWP